MKIRSHMLTSKDMHLHSTFHQLKNNPDTLWPMRYFWTAVVVIQEVCYAMCAQQDPKPRSNDQRIGMFPNAHDGINRSGCHSLFLLCSSEWSSGILYPSKRTDRTLVCHFIWKAACCQYSPPSVLPWVLWSGVQIYCLFNQQLQTVM